MPPRKRQASDPTDPTPDPTPCGQCFPGGWPEGAEQAVGCAHGSWTRQWPPAASRANVGEASTEKAGEPGGKTEGETDTKDAG